MREISLRDIADRTKISRRYLEAMEADRFDLLPAPLFAKGFLREYARYVGLSPDDVVNHYLSVYNPEELVTEPKDDTLNRVRQRPKQFDSGQPPMRRNWSQGLILALAGLILLVLIALAAWFADRRRDAPPQTNQAPPMAAPPPAQAVVPTPAPPPPEPTAPLEVSLDFTDECWVDALIDARTRRAESRYAGEAIQLQAQQSIALKLGNAGVVEVQVNGYPLKLDAKPGEVRDIVIDLNTVQALKAQSPG
jgi:cytoskeleton protein RodZ